MAKRIVCAIAGVALVPVAGWALAVALNVWRADPWIALVLFTFAMVTIEAASDALRAAWRGHV